MPIHLLVSSVMHEQNNRWNTANVNLGNIKNVLWTENIAMIETIHWLDDEEKGERHVNLGTSKVLFPLLKVSTKYP